MSTGVLLGCADPELRGQFLDVLSEAGHIEVVEVVNDSTNLLIAADRDDVDLVLVHDLIEPLTVQQITKELVSARPYLPVLWLTETAEPAVLARAMEAGARAVLAAPFSLESTASRIDAAAAWSRSLISHVGRDGVAGGRRGSVLALAGAKGGVGTTVLATLLAESAVGPGRSVVLVDLDLRAGAVAFYTDISARRSVADLAEVAGELTGRSVHEVVHQHPGGLSVLIAPEEVDRAEDVTAPAVRQILGQLRMQYTHVVVDCGSRLDDVTATALENADEVCLVLTPDIVAVRAGRRTLQMWDRLDVRRPEGVKVLLNRVSRNSEVQPDLVRQILDAPVSAQVPAAFSSLEPSINTGILDAKRGPVHAAVAQAAVALRLREPTGQPRRAGAPRERRSRGAKTPVAPGPDSSGPDPSSPDPSGPDPSGPRGAGPGRNERLAEAGQIIAELPMLVLLLGIGAWCCLQMAIWGTSHVFAEHAALAGSRAASVSADPAVLNAAVDKALPLAWGNGWTVQRGAETVTVTVRTPQIMPSLGVDLDVRSTAHVEPEP